MSLVLAYEVTEPLEDSGVKGVVKLVDHSVNVVFVIADHNLEPVHLLVHHFCSFLNVNIIRTSREKDRMDEGCGIRS